jgi:nickel transport protein
MPVVLGTAIGSWISAAHAHEFIIKPAAFHVNVGDKVPFRVLSTHVFMIGEELLAANNVKASLFEGNKSVDLPLKENHILQTLDGTAVVHAKGTAVIAGRLLEPVETLKGQDTGKTQRARFEKFSKSLIVVGAPDRNYEKVLGHRLEIVPTNDPTAVRVGDELVFRILFDSKPLQTNVFATYDGFSRYYNTYAYVTESRDGLARVKITHPGTWLVRVERRMPVAEKDYDLHVLKAVLVFPVE